ncbi:MAG: efflux RND transporter periplasmic adaptor subunit [Bacteroidales bacterium]|nr:efflux RND transporter periplasmic adaptor subunit [Bacteroidales bacterium]
MKQTVIILVTILMVSCGGGKKTTDEIQKEISTYKQQIVDINGKIKELEKELTKLDTGQISTKDLGKPVAIKVVEPEPFNHYIEVQGKLDGDKNVSVFPEAPGILTDIFVKIGDHVTAGQILAKTNDAAVREQLKALESQLALNTEMFEKQKSLWEQNIGSEIQYLQSKTAKEALESQVAGVKKQLEMMTIKAPVSGNIETFNIKLGQMVGPQMPVCNIVSLNALKAVAEVAEAHGPKIKEGDKVVVYIPDLKKEIQSRINFSSKFISNITRTFTVEANFEGTNEMKANMIVVVRINDYNSPKAFVVPINLVQEDNNNKFVFVTEKDSANNNVIAKKIVTIGQTYNGLAEVVSGLSKGDKLVTSGYLTVIEGETVSIQ